MDPKYEFDAPQFVDFNAFENTAEADALFDMTTVGDYKAEASARRGLRDVSNTPECAVRGRLSKNADGTASPRAASVTRAASKRAAALSTSTTFGETQNKGKSTPAVNDKPSNLGCGYEDGGDPSKLDECSNSPVVSGSTCNSSLSSPVGGQPEADVHLQLSFARGICNQSTACKKKVPQQLPRSAQAEAAEAVASKTLRSRRALLQGSAERERSRVGDSSVNTVSNDGSHLVDTSAGTLSMDGGGTSSRKRRSPGASGGPSLRSNDVSAARATACPTAAKMPKLTIPVTPPFAKQRPRRQAAEVKTTEQLELEEIARMRKKLQQQRKRNIKAADDGAKPSSETAGKAREGGRSPVKVTVPQPFHFHASHKQSTADIPSAPVPFRSTAELLEEFSRKTPQRFHGKPSTPADAIAANSSSRSSEKHPTVPKTPNLRTMKRQRLGYHIPSAEEREEKELEEMKAHQFKAHPVDHRIFEKVIGVKAVGQKELTEVAPPRFATDERLRKRAAVAAAACAAVPEEKTASGDLPVLTKTISEPTLVAASAEVRHHVGLPFQPKLKHKHTVVQPFSFEHKDKEAEERRLQLLQQTLEEERKAREFRAQPLPPTPEPLPQRKIASPTHVQEFKLAVDSRGTLHQAKLKQKLEEEEKERDHHVRSLMRARTPEVLYKKPFQPQKSQKPLTEPQEIQLELDKRIPAWEKHDAETKQREAEIAAAKRRRQQEEEEAEKAERAKLRAEAIVRQNPIRHYKPLQILPSDKPVTEPCSPRFSDRLNRKRQATMDDSCDARAAKSAKNFL